MDGVAKGKESNEMCLWNFLGETLYYLLIFDFGYNIYFEKLSYSRSSLSVYIIFFHFYWGISINEYDLLSVNTELMQIHLVAINETA